MQAGMPSWLLEDECFVPASDRDGFLRGNTLRLVSLLSRVKAQRGGLEDARAIGPLDHVLGRVDPSVRIGAVLAIVICISSARNMFFVYCMFAAVLALLASKPASAIWDIVKTAGGAALAAAVIMVPAVFLGQPASLLRISSKVFLDVALITQLNRIVAWHELVAGFRSYRLPSIVIFIFDIAIKYIVMLGEVALGVLDALNLRSIGHNPGKSGAASGVMGVTFLKARDYGSEMYQAMECRGFVGEYEVPAHALAAKADLLYALGAVACVALFAYLEGAM